MTVGYVLSLLIGLLPEAGVVLAGFVVVSRARGRLGRRSTLLARLGLGAVGCSLLVSLGWNVLIVQLTGLTSLSASAFGLINVITGLLRTVFLAGGIGLLLAALLSRNPDGKGLADRAPGGFLGTTQPASPVVPEQGAWQRPGGHPGF